LHPGPARRRGGHFSTGSQSGWTASGLRPRGLASPRLSEQRRKRVHTIPRKFVNANSPRPSFHDPFTPAYVGIVNIGPPVVARAPEPRRAGPHPFRMVWPLSASPQDRRSPPRPRGSRKRLSHRTMSDPATILVVDDERDLVELLSVNLEAAGYTVIPAYKGDDALRKASEHVPTLVLLDLMMPGLSGTEVARRLRADPRTSRIPIIMLTARAAEADQIVGLSVGADDYITKPFSFKVLLARIEAILRRTTA